jgi:hypothetical protein
MKEGALLDTLTDLLGSVPQDVARRAVASLADKFGVQATATKRGGLSGSNDDEDDEDDRLDYQSSLGTSESINLRAHDRKVRKVLRGSLGLRGALGLFGLFCA